MVESTPKKRTKKETNGTDTPLKKKKIETSDEDDDENGKSSNVSFNVVTTPRQTPVRGRKPVKYNLGTVILIVNVKMLLLIQVRAKMKVTMMMLRLLN